MCLNAIKPHINQGKITNPNRTKDPLEDYCQETQDDCPSYERLLPTLKASRLN